MGTTFTKYIDTVTAATVIQWTTGPHKNQHLYFTSQSVTSDGHWLIIISDREGDPNLFSIDRYDGTFRRLSRNSHGLLRSYVYPQGGLEGLSKASPCLDSERNRLYYIRDDTVFLVNLDNPEINEEPIFQMPPRWYGAFTHISPDGKILCVPCTDPRAFTDKVDTQWEQMRKVPDRMKEYELMSRIYLIDVFTGQVKQMVTVPFWVTHVQFDPVGTGRIIFNREGFVEDIENTPHNRIWCLEPDGAYHPLAPEAPGEWRAHENWAVDGESIVYHGAQGERAFVAARDWSGKLLYETNIKGIEFWHATAMPDGQRLLVDRPDGFISVVDPQSEDNRIVNLCRHDTTIEDQDSHAHPLVTPDGKSAIFTSNKAGNCDVYEVLFPLKS